MLILLTKFSKSPEKFETEKTHEQFFFYLGSIKVEFRTRKIKFFPLPVAVYFSQIVWLPIAISCQSRILFYENRAWQRENMNKTMCTHIESERKGGEVKCLA